MEFKDNWHFVNSEENRVRLSAYWTATMFAVDCGWNVGRVGKPSRAAGHGHKLGLQCLEELVKDGVNAI
jgi:hypothetical protein